MVGEEEIVEVQKNYSEEVIQEIQNAINSKNATIKVLLSIDELPNTIYIDNAKLVLSHNDRYDTCLYLDNSMDSESAKRWRTESIYVFYHKDWKRLNKDIDIFENNNYIEITFTVKDIEIVALLRRVDLELKDDSFKLMEYGEIYYNDAQYTIIKAFSPTINERYSIVSMLENKNSRYEKMYDSFGTEVIVTADGKYNIIDNGEDNMNVSIESIPDPESEELF